MEKQLLTLLWVLFPVIMFGQNKTIQLSKNTNNDIVAIEEKGYDGFDMSINISEISLKKENIGGNDFLILNVEGLSKIFEVGNPEIPNFSKLIEIPIGASVKVKTISFYEEYIDLSEEGFNYKIVPAQPSQSKNNDSPEFYFNEQIYSLDSYIEKAICDFEEIGMLRGSRLGRVIISPIQYNPSKNMLKILNNLRVSISFENVDMEKTTLLKEKYGSYIFDNVVREYTLNNLSQTVYNYSTNSQTYVIISDRMFEEIISDFASAKENLGYNVLVKYTDEPSVGTTTTSIKNYLNSIYNNPPSGYSVPVYVLLVGDVNQIPSFQIPPSINENSHVTDLYYFDYTNDYIPDVLYGRFSANNIDELTPQIMKSVYYESYVAPEPSYLYNAVLVAGEDAFYGTREANGTINYAVNQYFNVAHDITAYTYYQPEPVNNNYSSSIKNNINNGVGIVYYTAHCTPLGWVSPNFTINDISSLTNVGKYGLWIGNCCQSNKFDEEVCFGEAAMRANNTGAMGYIGATNYTYWGEDFYWANGVKEVSSNPPFDANHLGAFDRYFQMDTIPYFHQGQFILAGNLSVEESNSQKKQYYWEVYHLLGDPSVKIELYCGTTTISETISTYGWYRDYKINIQNTRIQNNARVICESLQSTTINGPFEVELGSTIYIR